MDFKETLKVFKRQKLVIIISFLIILSSYFSVYIFNPKPFVATSKVMILKNNYTMDILKDNVVIPKPLSANTQIEIIKGKTLAEEVCNYIQQVYGSKLKKISPNILQSMVFAKQASNSDVLEISVKSYDEFSAVVLANTYAELLERKNKELQNSELLNAKSFLEQQIANNNLRLARAEEKINKFKQEKNIVDLDTELKLILEKTSDYETEKMKTLLYLNQLNVEIKNLESKLSSTDKSIKLTNIVVNPDMQEIKKNLTSLEEEHLKLKEKYSPGHPKIKEIQAQIQNTQNKLQTKVAKFLEVPQIVSNPVYSYLTQELINKKIEVMSQGAKIQALDNYSKIENKGLQNLSEAKMVYFKEEQEYKTAEKINNLLQEMYEQIKLTKAMRESNIKVIEKASQAINEKYPLWQTMAFILFLALAISFGLGFFLEVIDDKVRRAFTAKKLLNLPVLASIPFLLKSELTLSNTSLPSYECFRRLYFGIKLTMYDKNVKTFLITSVGPGAGKSTILKNLAVVATREGKKTVVLDSDTRNPAQHKLFNVPNYPGLISYLSGQIEEDNFLTKLKDNKEQIINIPHLPEPTEQLFKSIIHTTSFPGLDVIPAGAVVNNLVETISLNEVRFLKLIEFLKKSYDLILVDSPPVMVVVDSLLVGSYLESCVLVIDADNTPKKDALAARNILKNAKINLSGVILNKITEQEEEYYYYYSKYYQKKHLLKS